MSFEEWWKEEIDLPRGLQTERIEAYSKKAYAAGRKAGLEEAARIAETDPRFNYPCELDNAPCIAQDIDCQLCRAEAIRREM